MPSSEQLALYPSSLPPSSRAAESISSKLQLVSWNQSATSPSSFNLRLGFFFNIFVKVINRCYPSKAPASSPLNRPLSSLPARDLPLWEKNAVPSISEMLFSSRAYKKESLSPSARYDQSLLTLVPPRDACFRSVSEALSRKQSFYCRFKARSPPEMTPTEKRKVYQHYKRLRSKFALFNPPKSLRSALLAQSAPNCFSVSRIKFSSLSSIFQHPLWASLVPEVFCCHHFSTETGWKTSNLHRSLKFMTRETTLEKKNHLFREIWSLISMRYPDWINFSVGWPMRR